MVASLFNTIILLGSIQGFIVFGLLFCSKRNQPANRLLAVLILLISLACFNLYANYANWFGSSLLRLIFQFVPLVLVMPFGPLMYFYIRSHLEPGFRIAKNQRRHFYSAIIDLVPSITVLLFFAGVVSKLVQNNPGPWGSFIDDYNVYADIPRWASLSFYVWLSHQYLSAYKTSHADYPAAQSGNFRWLRQFVRVFMVFQLLWLLYLVPYTIPAYTNWMLDTFDWYPIYIPMAVLIYWLGIKGWMVSQIQPIPEKKSGGNPSSISAEQVKEVIVSLTKAMEMDKIFLNPQLNLTTISLATGFPQKIISAVLNQHLDKSFNEFVNGYRVNAFREKIMQPEMNHLTIAGIALECGFNSQATFQRTFKEITGQSPTAYRKSSTVAGQSPAHIKAKTTQIRI